MTILTTIDDPGRLADMVGSNMRLKIPEGPGHPRDHRTGGPAAPGGQPLSKELEVSAVQAKIQSDAKGGNDPYPARVLSGVS